MTRALSTTDAAEVKTNVVGVVEFLELDLPTGTLFLTNGNKSYTWGGNTYTPIGTQFGQISNYNEALDGVPRPMNLTMSGVDPTLIQALVQNNVQFIPVIWSVGFIDVNNNLLDNPTFAAPMFLGDCTITLGANGSNSISISCESLLADMQNRTSGCLQTNADQQARFSGDTFYRDIGTLVNKTIYWGQYGPTQVGKTAAAGGPTGVASTPIGGGGGVVTFDPGNGFGGFGVTTLV